MGSHAVLLGAMLGLVAGQGPPRPHLVWIVVDDIGPHLGCYGDPCARTPHFDAFARQAVRFDRAFTHAPVCAPSRSGLITGRYPTSIGTHHMRSQLLQPPPTFTSLLRQNGYTVLWPGKTDFNFVVPPDAFTATTDWTRGPVPGGPCFLYVNSTAAHESQIRPTPEQRRKNLAELTPEELHDPARVEIPPYFPDSSEVRRDIATYHDNLTAVDKWFGRILAHLEQQGITAANSYVFVFGDHGWGMPRGKRWLYDSGTRVPLLVRGPGLRPGTVSGDLVSFIDFAPTMLALAGVPIPPAMEGQPFLGPSARPREYVISCRDRMDETYDRIRAVRDARWRYIRNFHPELPYAQRIGYMELMPTMQAWRREHAAGRLTGPAAAFFAPTKPAEELYDLATDPHEIHNRVADPVCAVKLAELRRALDRWIAASGDLGAVPEAELVRRGLVKDMREFYAQGRHLESGKKK